MRLWGVARGRKEKYFQGPVTVGGCGIRTGEGDD